MNTARTALSMLSLVSILAAGCADAVGPVPGESPAETSMASSSGLRLEQAERSLDAGGDAAAAKAAVLLTLAEASSTQEERDRALLALSRAEEALGDREAAIVALENLLGAHSVGGGFATEEAAEKRLRKLLTGKEEAEGRIVARGTATVAPIARALVGYFGEDERHRTSVNILHYGRFSDDGEKLGTFALSEALKQKAREACPLCEEKVNVHTSESGYGSWSAIPRNTRREASALVVYYVDAKDPVPARYDSHLPMPSAEIAARLARGEGFIAVKQREGAPPVVLLAAPRQAQLRDVEAAFAAMTSLPASPVSVTLKDSPRPVEIQSAVRASFGAFRACYEALQEATPKATGKLILDFGITPEGKVEKATIDPESTLRDPTFDACMLTGASRISFPASSGRTTVKYPIVFSPG
jgi:hypothetical protein